MLKKIEIGTAIKLKDGAKWKTPFYIESLNSTWAIAVNRRISYDPKTIVLNLRTNEVYLEVGLYSKYKMYNKTAQKKFLDKLVHNQIVLPKTNCYPVTLILDSSCFELLEKKEQIKVVDEEDKYFA
jgi:hypothetical protein